MKLLKYDFFYLKKTNKFIIFPAVAILFAIISPLTAMYLKDLLEMLGVDFVIVPDPSVLDSYTQYISDLFEIFMFVVLFISVSMFIRDKTKGYLPLVLSKPINRTKYLLSKYVSLFIVIAVSLGISGIVFGYYTYILFGEIDVMIIVFTTLLYLLYILFILSVTMLYSQLFSNYAAASILSFVTYLFFNVLGSIEVSIFDYLPGRIIFRISEVIMGITELSSMIWTIIITIILTILFSVLSILKFKKYDI